MLTCSMIKFLSRLLLGLCRCVVSVVVFGLSVRLPRLPYVNVVVAVTVMRVLLFVLHVCLLRECDGARLKHTFTAGSVSLCCVCGRLWSVCEVAAVALCECGGCCDCDACTVVCIACVFAERV